MYNSSTGIETPGEEEVTPVPVMADKNNVLTNVKAIAAGSNHTVFLMNDDTVYAVGNNELGQLGNGKGTWNELEEYPVQVMANENNVLTGVKAIAAGSNHTVFLKDDNTAWSVGSNWTGQLGDGTVVNKSTPVVSFG